MLKEVSVEVDAELEITEIVQQCYQRFTSPPAMLFTNVKGSKFPLLINLLGSEKSIELLLGESPEQVGKNFSSLFTTAQNALARKKMFSWLWKQKKFLLRVLSARTVFVSSATCKEIKKTGNQINLNEFPIMKCWPEDGGKFITAGLVLTKSPKTGTRNLGIYRLQLLSQNELILHWQIQKGGGFHYAEAEELNQPLEIAIVIGADPILWFAGILPLPEGVDEISFAGFLRGRAVPMIRCETINLEVPASAEIVIEGIAQPKRRALEGPFGDHFGHYSHPAPFPVLEISCITHKKNAIYHSAVVGKPPQEDKAMGEAVSKIFLPFIQMQKPELTDLWAYYETGFHNLLVASVKQRYEKEGIKTALGLLGEWQLSLTKCLVLVDGDVPVKNFGAVLRAIQQNFEPEQDFILLPGTAQDTLDFTGQKMNRGSKIILDATSNGSPQSIVHRPQFEPKDLKSVDWRILGCRVVEDTLLVVQVKEKGKEILKKLLELPEIQKLKIVACVSEDVPLEKEVLLLCGIFTRFDCEQDIFFAHSKLEGARTIHSGAMAIDATWKPHYPKPIEMSQEVIEKVKRRWKEYGF